MFLNCKEACILKHTFYVWSYIKHMGRIYNKQITNIKTVMESLKILLIFLLIIKIDYLHNIVKESAVYIYHNIV